MEKTCKPYVNMGGLGGNPPQPGPKRDRGPGKREKISIGIGENGKISIGVGGKVKNWHWGRVKWKNYEEIIEI